MPWSLTRDRDAADDLVQDCLERALRKRVLWLPGRPVKPWLTKMMLNLYRDQYRRHRRQETHPMDPQDLVGTAGQCVIEDQLELQAVWHSLSHLPEPQREALLAVVVGGLTYDQAAESLGVPRGTVMSRIARARAQLRAAIDTPSSPKIRSVK